MLRQLVVSELLRLVKSRGGLPPFVKQSCFQDRKSERLIAFILQEDGLATSIFRRMHSSFPISIAKRLYKIPLPLQTRTLCDVRHGEQDLQRSARREQSKKGVDDGLLTEENDLMLHISGRGQGQVLQTKSSRKGSGWPWISVVPSEVTGVHIGRKSKDNEVKVYTAKPEYERSVLPSEPVVFPLVHRISGLENFLPPGISVQICAILSKYGWSAHTLLELRTLVSTRTKLKAKHVLDVLNRQRDADLAYNFLAWSLEEAKCRVHISCFTVVLGLLRRERKYDLMEKLLEDLDNRGYVMDKIVFTAAMRCYAEGQRVQDALELFVKMKESGLKPDCVTYSVLMQMLSKAKLYQEALNLYDEMLAQGVATDTQVYNCVVSIFGKAGRLDLAYEKLEEMRVRGHVPDEFTYGALLEGYAKAGRPEFMDLYREMKSAGIPVNEVIFNIMFLGIEHIGTLSDAEGLFADMEQVGLSANINAFSTLISMSSKVGYAEGAQRWFDKMTSMGIKPTLAVGNSLLDSYARAKRFDRAKQIVDAFQSWGLTPNLPTATVCMRCLNLCERPEDLKIVQSMLSCHSGGLFLSELLGKPPEHDLAPVIASFLKSLHFERRVDRRAFINVLIDYLYKNGFRSQAYQVLEGALANYVFPGLVEQGLEAICSVNLRGMERGTAVIALTHTLPRLAKQFHRKEMTPEWVQICTVSGKDEIAIGDPTSVHESVHVLLKTLHSPFRACTLQTGGGFVCRGEEVMYWLDDPEIKAMLAYKH